MTIVAAIITVRCGTFWLIGISSHPALRARYATIAIDKSRQSQVQPCHSPFTWTLAEKLPMLAV